MASQKDLKESIDNIVKHLDELEDAEIPEKLKKEFKEGSEKLKKFQKKFEKNKDQPKEIKYLFENLWLDFLNEKGEIKEKNNNLFIEEVVPRIEKTTDLEYPEKVEILEYGSGKKMIYDAIVKLCDEFEIYDLATKRSKKKGSWYKEIPKGLAKTASLPILYLWFRKKTNYMGDKVLGTTDLNSINFGNKPLDLDDIETIGIVPKNISKASRKNGCDYKPIERHVMFHEGIHNSQEYTFSILNEKRKDLVNQLWKKLNEKNKKTEKELEDEMNALMSTMEGHAEYFTNKISEEEGEWKLNRDYSLREKFWHRVYGFKKKLEQYEKGSKFIGTLYNKGGTELVNEALETPPKTMKEIENPDIYISNNV